MQFTVGDIAAKLGVEVEGDASLEVTGVSGIDDASPGDLTFCVPGRYEARVPGCAASAIIVPTGFSRASRSALLRVDDPYAAFIQVLRIFRQEAAARPPGVDPSALVDASVRLGENVSVGPLCVVEAGAVLGDRTVLCPGVYVGSGARLGEECYIFPNVTLREEVVLGRGVIVHSGTVIGADGFGYLTRSNGHEKIPQVGTVIIGDEVEIGANVAIDRGTLGATRIGRGVKIDNLVHVAHNVVVGEDTLLVAQVGISGSTEIGRRTTLAGQAGLVGHIRIGDGVQIGAQAGVTKSIPDNVRVSGYPAMEHNRARRLNAYYRRLPGLFEELKRLEERVRELEGAREKIL